MNLNFVISFPIYLRRFGVSSIFYIEKFSEHREITGMKESVNVFSYFLMSKTLLPFSLCRPSNKIESSTEFEYSLAFWFYSSMMFENSWCVFVWPICGCLLNWFPDYLLEDNFFTIFLLLFFFLKLKFISCVYIVVRCLTLLL